MTTARATVPPIRWIRLSWEEASGMDCGRIDWKARVISRHDRQSGAQAPHHEARAQQHVRGVRGQRGQRHGRQHRQGDADDDGAATAQPLHQHPAQPGRGDHAEASRGHQQTGRHGRLAAGGLEVERDEHHRRVEDEAQAEDVDRGRPVHAVGEQAHVEQRVGRAQFPYDEHGTARHGEGQRDQEGRPSVEGVVGELVHGQHGADRAGGRGHQADHVQRLGGTLPRAVRGDPAQGDVQQAGCRAGR